MPRPRLSRTHTHTQTEVRALRYSTSLRIVLSQRKFTNFSETQKLATMTACRRCCERKQTIVSIDNLSNRTRVSLASVETKVVHCYLGQIEHFWVAVVARSSRKKVLSGCKEWIVVHSASSYWTKTTGLCCLGINGGIREEEACRGGRWSGRRV